MQKQPLRSKKTGRYEELFGFARSHSIVTRDSVSRSRATTPDPSCFLNLNGTPSECQKPVDFQFNFIFKKIDL